MQQQSLFGDAPSRRPPLTSRQREEMVAAYQRGEKMDDIAERYGVSISAVSKFRKMSGAPERRLPGHRHGHEVDESVFDSPGREGRYWIGFLITDGCIGVAKGREHRPMVIFALALRDQAHVGAFRSYLHSTHKISLRLPFERTSKDGTLIRSSGIARLSVVSHRLAAALARYGVVPRKSHDAEVIGLERDRDFWRGAIDGDGCLYFTSSRGYTAPVISFIGSRQLVTQFADFAKSVVPETKARIHQKKGEPFTCSWAVGGLYAQAIVRALYVGADVALPRKAELASKILAWRPTGPKPARLCSADGCERLHKSKGLCSMHYQRFRRKLTEEI